MQCHVTGTNYDIHVIDTLHGWHAWGYIGDAEIDTQWNDVHNLSFEELDSLILEVMQSELN